MITAMKIDRLITILAIAAMGIGVIPIHAVG